MVKRKTELSFEEAIDKLETITTELEAGSMNLEESLAAFQEGMQLSIFCRETLEKADGSIREILKNAEGNMELTDLEIDQ